MNHGFDAQGLERRYSVIDGCPPALVADVVTLPLGTLDERVTGVRRWYDALLEGLEPPFGSWPQAVVEPVRRAISTLGIARFCRGQQELVELLMKDVLRALGAQADLLATEITEELRKLEALERETASMNAQRASAGDGQAAPDGLTEETMARLRAEAERRCAARDRGTDGGLVAGWEARVRAWSAVADVFDDLGELMGRGWDLTQGILRHTGWREIVRLRALMERLPQLAQIVRSLGRMSFADDEESVSETIFEPVRRIAEELHEVPTPLVPADVRGVERSGEIARMLPAEAAMLGHPKLRLLWHARRAERALMTYRVEGVELERVIVESEVSEAREAKRPRLERGPIVAVIDTSGSMHGDPETVAKAVVLEAMRTAHSERRRCFVYSFGGPGQVIEHELDLSAAGLGRLLEFLSASFGGGTDGTDALRRVAERVRQESWKKADVLFVSDGEWRPTDALLQSVAQARELSVRFHGVQIGNHGSTGLHEVCDPVHQFREWSAMLR